MTPEFLAAGDGYAALVVALIAIVLDGLLGNLPGLREVLDAPLAAIRGLTGWFDRRLNRESRGTAARRIRGAIVLVFVLAIAAAAGAGLDGLARRLPHGRIVDAMTLLFLIGFRQPLGLMRRTAAGLGVGDGAAVVAGRLVRHDVDAGDAHAVARAAVEGGTRRVVDGVFGALFWYLLFGLPALCLYRAIGAGANVIGGSSPRHTDFGFAMGRLDDVLSLPGALLAGPVLATAALFVAGANPARAFAGWARDLAARALGGGFRAEGAMAGAFGLSLGGPRLHDGEARPGPWIGDGRARLEAGDVRRAANLLAVATLIVALGLALALAASGRF